MKKIVSFGMIFFLLMIGMLSCTVNPTEKKDATEKTTEQSETTEVSDQILQQDFSKTLEMAKGTTVTFYGWGGSDKINSWLDGYVTDQLKKEYDITLKRVGMNIDEILNLLLNEKQAKKQEGNIDIIWINGENFYTAKKQGLLFGPFTEKLPNFQKYVDGDSPDIKMDFGLETEGFESPYGKAQFVFAFNSTYLNKFPSGAQELLAFAKEHPGKLTYPAPPDFTGSCFVRNVVCDLVDYSQFMSMPADEETVKKAIQPALDYLKELKPYLWKEGKTYPAEAPKLDQMYADGQLWMTMSYNPNDAQGKIENGSFPETTRTAIWESGTIGNTHFLAIAQNAPNKKGAMAVINFILSPQVQVSKYDPKTWGDLPVLDQSKLSESERKMFQEVPLGEAILPSEQLLEKRIPEMPANIVPIIEKIWMEEIPGE